MAIVLDD
jgi:hypothetical protein